MQNTLPGKPACLDTAFGMDNILTLLFKSYLSEGLVTFAYSLQSTLLTVATVIAIAAQNPFKFAPYEFKLRFKSPIFVRNPLL